MGKKKRMQTMKTNAHIGIKKPHPKARPTPLTALGRRGHWMSAEKTLSGLPVAGSAQICPIDIWAKLFASNRASRFALDIYTKAFTGTALTIGNISKECVGGVALCGEGFSLSD